MADDERRRLALLGETLRRADGALAVGAVIDGDGTQRFQLRLHVEHASFPICAPRATAIDAYELARTFRQALAALVDSSPWQRAVEEACIAHSLDLPGDKPPEEALAELLAMAVTMALEPDISPAARALVERGRKLEAANVAAIAALSAMLRQASKART